MSVVHNYKLLFSYPNALLLHLSYTFSVIPMNIFCLPMLSNNHQRMCWLVCVKIKQRLIKFWYLHHHYQICTWNAVLINQNLINDDRWMVYRSILIFQFIFYFASNIWPFNAAYMQARGHILPKDYQHQQHLSRKTDCFCLT